MYGGRVMVMVAVALRGALIVVRFVGKGVSVIINMLLGAISVEVGFVAFKILISLHDAKINELINAKVKMVVHVK